MSLLLPCMDHGVLYTFLFCHVECQASDSWGAVGGIEPESEVVPHKAVWPEVGEGRGGVLGG